MKKENLKRLLLALGLSLSLNNLAYADEINLTPAIEKNEELEPSDQNKLELSPEETISSNLNEIQETDPSIEENTLENQNEVQELGPSLDLESNQENDMGENEFENLSDEEVLQKVLEIYGSNYNDFASVAGLIMEEAIKNNAPYENIYGVARAFLLLSKIPREEKLEVVLPYFNISYEEFDTVQAVSVLESKSDDGKNYFSGYLVANHLCARNNSHTWAYCGPTIFNQVMKKGQYDVVTKNTYRKALGKDSFIYQAVLDRMFVEACEGEFQLYTRPYLEFRSSGHRGDEFIPNDNVYRMIQSDNDRIRPRPIKQEQDVFVLSLK